MWKDMADWIGAKFEHHDIALVFGAAYGWVGD